MTERRATPRYPVLRQGWICAGPLRESFCTIRDLSVGGVQVRLQDAAPLPDVVDVLLSSDGLYYPARISWRRGALIGLQFCTKPEAKFVYKPSGVAVSEPAYSNSDLAFRIRALIHKSSSNHREWQAAKI